MGMVTVEDQAVRPPVREELGLVRGGFGCLEKGRGYGRARRRRADEGGDGSGAGCIVDRHDGCGGPLGREWRTGRIEKTKSI